MCLVLTCVMLTPESVVLVLLLAHISRHACCQGNCCEAHVCIRKQHISNATMAIKGGMTMRRVIGCLFAGIPCEGQADGGQCQPAEAGTGGHGDEGVTGI